MAGVFFHGRCFSRKGTPQKEPHIMTMMTISARDGGTFNAYVALPQVLPAPVVIVIQEIFGINHVMRAKCDEMATLGYIAVSPDLFWRIEPGIDLTDKTDAEWAKAFDLFKRFNVDLGIKDLQATFDTMKQYPQGTGKVGCIGYCLGGKLAYLMGTRVHPDCAVGYYGVGLDELLNESATIRTPLMLHIAEEDKFVSKDAQAKIIAALKDNPLVTLHSYAGMDHAFSRIEGTHYNEAAAALANGRTAKFLQQYLRQAAA